MRVPRFLWMGGVPLVLAWAACSPAVPPAPAAASGEGIYTENCATCHMADGSGVPRLQPSLAGNPYVSGDPDTLIRIVLRGPDKVLPAERESYSNTMPGFSQLSDAEIAATLTYLRQQFGGRASPISESQVAAARQ